MEERREKEEKGRVKGLKMNLRKLCSFGLVYFA